MPTDTKLNQLIINQLTQEQYEEAKAAGTLSDTELYITDSDDEALTNNNISNCITEIPQDIKLELNNGTLTLKAGSKVYVPNGFESDGTTKKFDVVNIQRDITVAAPYTNEPIFIYYHNNGTEQASNNAQCSGTSNTVGAGYWYDTTNNFIKRINAYEVAYSGVSFPLVIVNASNGSWTSINQVFNGFGYIGSTIFALPGVKGRIPNGRNEDGSLKSIEFTLDKVSTYNCNISSYFGIKLEGTEPILGIYGEQLYNSTSNTVIFNGITYKWMYSGSLIYSNGKITSFTPKTVFHALDYNDKSTISGWSMPSNRYIDLTLGADGSTYTAPANGYFYLKKDFTASGQYIWFELYNSTDTDTVMDITFWGSGAGFIGGFIPVSKGRKVRIYYNASGAVKSFRFIYAEGESYNPVSRGISGGETGGIGGVPSESGGETGGIDNID